MHGDLVALAKQRQEQRFDRRHARGNGDTGLGALQIGQPPFEDCRRRIVLARVGRLRLLSNRFSLRHALEGEVEVM
jgi:hypothetical protein